MTFYEYQMYFDKQVENNAKAELPKEMFSDWKQQHDMYNKLAKHIMESTNLFDLKDTKEINDTINTVDNITRKALNITTMYLEMVNQVKKYNYELENPDLTKRVQAIEKQLNDLKKA